MRYITLFIVFSKEKTCELLTSDVHNISVQSEHAPGQDLRFSMKMMSEPDIVPRQPAVVMASSGRLLLQFDAGSEASIFMRKALHIRPRNQKMH